MRRAIVLCTLILITAALLTVGSAWGLWLARPAATRAALDADAVRTVLEHEYGALVEPFGQHGMVQAGFGWRDTFATSGTLDGTRQVRVVEAGWPRPCVFGKERPREADRGFVTLPLLARWTEGDGRVPFMPRWSGLGVNFILACALTGGAALLAQLGARRTAPDTA